jgi:DNA-binding NtrC family response regulator
MGTGVVDLSRESPAFGRPGGAERPLEDRHLSRTPIRLNVVSGAVEVRVGEGASLIADGVSVAGSTRYPPADLDRGVVLELSDRVVLLLHRRHASDPTPVPPLGLVGANDAIDDLRRNILRVADLPVPVLIRGETGTGKDLIARAVHTASNRAARPFVAVNIAAIPSSTAASELFGHARGAFTGAVSDHAGYFGDADTGSLFLDEIGATPTDIQPILLRALESNEIQPLGATATRKVDVRLLAATDADLEQAISDESFRAALLHRLEGYQLFVPPLRDRRDDIGRLMIHFLRVELERIGEAHKLDVPERGQPTWLPASFVARLARLDWPGNVRQLKNTVRQFAISSRGADTVVIDAAVSRLLGAAEALPDAANEATSASRKPADIADAELIDALRDNDWLANKAAVQLGVSRSYLYERIKSCPDVPNAKDLDREVIAACRTSCDGDTAETARRLQVSKRALTLRMKELGLL